MVYDKVHMVLAQGDMVLGVSEGTFGDAPTSYYDLWRYTNANPDATYACLNYGEAYAHRSIRERAILIESDIDQVLDDLLKGRNERQ